MLSTSPHKYFNYILPDLPRSLARLVSLSGFCGVSVSSFSGTTKQNCPNHYCWRRYHEELHSQLIALKSRFFPFENTNLQCYGSVVKFSVFKTRQFQVLTFKVFGVFQSFGFTKANLYTSYKPSPLLPYPLFTTRHGDIATPNVNSTCIVWIT